MQVIYNIRIIFFAIQFYFNTKINKGGLNLCDQSAGQRPGVTCAKKAKSKG